jgi:glutaredoxin
MLGQKNSIGIMNTSSSSTGTASVPQIAIITTIGCPYCKMAKDALRRLNLRFAEIELSTDLDTLRTVKKATSQATVPQASMGFPGP